jgi:hypothetical protein
MADASTPSLGARLGQAAVLVVVVVGVPVALGAVAAGGSGIRAAALGAIFTFLLAARTGWRRALVWQPVLIAAVAGASVTSGSWWWVVWLATLGAAAGAASAAGLLVPLAISGMLAASAPELDPGEGLLARLALAAAAGLYVVVVGRRSGLPAQLPEPRAPRQVAVLAAVVVGLVVAVAATIALRWSDPYAYWLPVTVFVLLLPTPGIRLSRRAAQRAIGAVVGCAAAVPLAAWGLPLAVRAPLAVVALLLVLAVPQPGWLNGALSTWLIVLLLDPSGPGLAVGVTRIVDVLLATALVLVAAAVTYRWGSRLLAGERPLVAEQVAAQRDAQPQKPEPRGGDAA